LDDELPELLVRGMKKSDDGKPETGDSSRTLGVRNPSDIEPDSQAMVGPGFHGMSVSPLPVDNLPKHRRPSEFGGTGRDPVFCIKTVHLGSFNLKYIQDPNNLGHGFIAPAQQMSYTEYVQNLHNTRDYWTHFGKDGDKDEDS